MLLAADDFPDIWHNADFFGAGLVRSITGNVVAGGLFLLALSLATHLLITRMGWWEAAPAVARMIGVSLLVVLAGVVVGLPAGGADLRPVWSVVRLVVYAVSGVGLALLAGRAVMLRRARAGR